jgi:hypothetical protein
MVAEMLQRTLTAEKLPENVGGKDAVRLLAMRAATRIHDDRYLHFITFLDIANRVVWSTLPEKRRQEAELFAKEFPQPAGSLTTAVIRNPFDGRRLVLLQFPWKYKGAIFGRVQITLPIMQPENESLFFRLAYSGNSSRLRRNSHSFRSAASEPHGNGTHWPHDFRQSAAWQTATMTSVCGKTKARSYPNWRSPSTTWRSPWPKMKNWLRIRFRSFWI